MHKRRILIAQPNLYNYSQFFPNVWATLKAYCNQYPELNEAYEWLPPIILNLTSDELLRPYEVRKIDILGLSCYLWNTRTCFEIARRVKAENPNAFVVAGGPNLDFSDPEFFDRHPYIDVLVRGEGEPALRDLLRARLAGSIPAPGTRISAEKLLDFGPSPWFDPFLDELSRDDIRRRLAWETNRGCPYACSFCDWGSATNSRVRTIDEARLHREIERFADLKVSHLMITDGNFGLLPRDLEIARHLCEIKRKTGFPQTVMYSDAKNGVERVVQIAELFHRAGLIESHSFGFQHTDSEVLANMHRQNISFERLKEKAQRLQQAGIPVSPALVLGSPGDTPDRLLKAYDEIMELGFHDEYRSTIWHLLPGAPAWSKSYRDRHKLRTVRRRVGTLRRKKEFSIEEGTKVEFIVESGSFNAEEWVEMYLLSVMMEAMHNAGPTRFLALYQRRQGVPFREFYTRLRTWLHTHPQTFLGGLFAVCREHMRRWACEESEDILEEIDIPELAHSRSCYRPEEYVFYRMIFHFDSAWNELEDFAREAFLSDEFWEDLLRYQREIMITEDYDAANGKIIPARYDWPSYFADPIAIRPEPLRGSGFKARTTHVGPQRDIPLDWISEPDPAQRRLKYSEAVFGVAHRRIARTFHSELEPLP